jgi:uncharacterized coiled-coil protein SlyX
MPDSIIATAKDIALGLLTLLGGGVGLKLLTHKADAAQQTAVTEKIESEKFSTPFEQAKQLLDWMKARILELQLYIEQLESKTAAQREMIGELKTQAIDLKVQIAALKSRLEALGQDVTGGAPLAAAGEAP